MTVKIVNIEKKRIGNIIAAAAMAACLFMPVQVMASRPEESKPDIEIKHRHGWLSVRDYADNIEKAEAGDREAQRIIARCYMSGIGVSTDYQKAWKWMSQAAAAGDNEAQYQLGVMYRDGIGVRKNAKESSYWFRRSARNGHPEALLALGKAFETGTGLLPDKEIAAHNYWAAGERGNAEGSYRYATMLRDGDGIPRDLPSALKYYRQAVAQGYTDAQKEVDALVALGIKAPAKPGVRKRSHIMSRSEKNTTAKHKYESGKKKNTKDKVKAKKSKKSGKSKRHRR